MGCQVENETVGGRVRGMATPMPGQHHHPAGSEGLSAWLSVMKTIKNGL